MVPTITIQAFENVLESLSPQALAIGVVNKVYVA
jgi:hypothetical protein